MKVKEKAEYFSKLWLHVNAGDEGMQALVSAAMCIKSVQQ
jgi:hypothetical protein